MDDKKKIFEEYPVFKALMVMAIPTIISQLITLVYNIADTWYIGMTDNPAMVAACSLVLPLYLLTITINNLYGTGGGSLVSRLMGVGREEEAKKVFSASMWMAFAMAVVYSAAVLIFRRPLLKLLGASEATMDYAEQYLIYVVGIGGVFNVLGMTLSNMIRSAGYSKEAGIGLSIGGVLNIGLDPLFMFVLLPDGMQVTGAAIATMLSSMVSFLYFAVILWKIRENPVISVDPRIGLPSKPSMSSIYSVGIPAAFATFLFDIAVMIANNRMAAHGDAALAAYGIITKIERLPLNVGIGICLGMVPLIAYNYTAKNPARLKAVFTAARLTGVGFAAVCVVLYRVFSPQIVRFFIGDEETVRLGTEFLQARCFATPFMFLSFNMVHFFNAVGKGKLSFLLAVVRQLVFNIPILLLLDSLYGASGLVWTQFTGDLLTVIVSYIVYYLACRRDPALQVRK